MAASYLAVTNVALTLIARITALHSVQRHINCSYSVNREGSWEQKETEAWLPGTHQWVVLEEQVLWLEISVSDVQGVTVLESLSDLHTQHTAGRNQQLSGYFNLHSRTFTHYIKKSIKSGAHLQTITLVLTVRHCKLKEHTGYKDASNKNTLKCLEWGTRCPADALLSTVIRLIVCKTVWDPISADKRLYWDCPDFKQYNV